jgi:hypothetical protein
MQWLRDDCRFLPDYGEWDRPDTDKPDGDNHAVDGDAVGDHVSGAECGGGGIVCGGNSPGAGREQQSGDRL